MSKDKIKMPEELRIKLEKLSPMARTYAEYRSKGLTQSEAAEKSGSKANGKEALGRVGYSWEQQDGVKEYTLWLEAQRVSAAMIDDIEIINGLRRVIDSAMEDKKYSDVNKALELLATMGGLLGSKASKTVDSLEGKKTKNNTSAFKEEGEPTEEDTQRERIKKLTKLIQDSKSLTKG